MLSNSENVLNHWAMMVLLTSFVNRVVYLLIVPYWLDRTKTGRFTNMYQNICKMQKQIKGRVIGEATGGTLNAKGNNY
jgi:hypothetical protein